MELKLALLLFSNIHRSACINCARGVLASNSTQQLSTNTSLSHSVFSHFGRSFCSLSRAKHRVSSLGELSQAFLLQQLHSLPVEVFDDASLRNAPSVDADVLHAVNQEIISLSKVPKRLFAVIELQGEQYKISQEDILTFGELQPFNPGDKIRLEKVFLVGSTGFTLVGRPLLPRDFVNIEATVLEKTWSNTQYRFVIIPRKQAHFHNWHRKPVNLIRVNKIEICGQLPIETALTPAASQ